MPLPTLTLPNSWETTQTISIPMRRTKLGDGYEQVVVDSPYEDVETWEVRSPILSTTEKDTVINQLRAYGGVDAFLWSPDDGAYTSKKAYYCKEWVVSPIGENCWKVSGTFYYDQGGECLAFANLIDENAIASQLATAINWNVIYTRSTRPYAVNQQGLAVNTFQDAPDTAGFYPPTVVSIGAQFLLMRGLLKARSLPQLPTESKSQALANTNLLASALVPYLYRGVAIPPTADSYLWLPHWFFNLKDAIPAKGKIGSKVENYGYYGLTISFANGIGYIPTGASNWGDRLSDVYKVYSLDGVLLWKNPYTPLVYGTEYAVSFWVCNSLLRGQNYRIAPTSVANAGYAIAPTSELAGKIVLNTNYTGSLNIAYAAYESTNIGVNVPLEVYPMLRGVGAKEINCTLDAFKWAWEVYALLFQATDNAQWQRAADATRSTAIACSTVMNQTYLFRKDAIAQEAFTQPGAQLVLFDSLSGGAAYRATDGGIRIDLFSGVADFRLGMTSVLLPLILDEDFS